MSPEVVLELHEKYHEALQAAEDDPYRYGFILPHWKHADEHFENFRTLLLLGANRSAKTRYGAKSVVKAALDNPQSLIFAFAQDDETSKLVQQQEVYLMLPAELKKRRTGAREYISYTLQNGFANSRVSFGNGSQIVFKKYTQYLQNPSILEGMKLGSPDPAWLNIGAWCDEYLLGMDMLNRLYLRLATHNAKLLLTFTPKDGETETVRNYRDKAKTISTRPAELMEIIHKKKNYIVPYIQHNEQKNTAIIYFHTKDNPWGGYESVVEICRAKNDPAYTLTAAYGVPTSSAQAVFPMFDTQVNVISHDKIPRGNVTRYMILDPAGRKNWFMCWIAVDATETYYVYREWPNVSVGDWAKIHSGKWIGGEGSKGLGYGIRDYVSLITSYEEGEEIFERLIDPRLGAAKYSTGDGSSSIIEDLSLAGLEFIPAPGLHIEDGIQAIQTKMAYDRKKPIDSLNRPHFYVSDRCENIIAALQNYTGEDGDNEAWKDPIDVIRYAAITPITHIDPNSMKIPNRKKGGY
jgi:hypothetical protein